MNVKDIKAFKAKQGTSIEERPSWEAVTQLYKFPAFHYCVHTNPLL